jgi:regulator of protease activity HflC (stomatin/prohibitin superfamily)
VVDLRLMQMDVSVKVKTSTGEFITLPTTIQYRVIEDEAAASFYEVYDPKAAITSLVQNEVKATASTMTLDAVFNSRDVIKASVRDKLTEVMTAYGFEIVDVLIDNPDVPEALEAAFNDVTAAKQRQLAAGADAEALKITMVGEANAEAQSLTIKAGAIVEFRETVAAGNALAVIRMTEGTTIPHSQALWYLTLVDTNDAVRDAAGKGATVVVATGRPNDGLYATLDGHVPTAA